MTKKIYGETLESHRGRNSGCSIPKARPVKAGDLIQVDYYFPIINPLSIQY